MYFTSELPDDMTPVSYTHLDVYKRQIVNASRNRIQKAAEDGFVMANGKPVKSSYKVKPLDEMCIRDRWDAKECDER